MTMMRKTITIPEPMEEWVKSQIKSGRYGNDSEYFRDLIRRDQDKKRAELELRSMIEDGLNSGISSKTAEDVRQGVLARLRADGKLPTQ